MVSLSSGGRLRFTMVAAITSALPPLTSALLQPMPRSSVQPTRARFTRDGWTTVPLVQRCSVQLFAQLNGWMTLIDEASGATYYYNEEAGVSQWEPPQAAAQEDDGGNQALWRLVGSPGTVVNGYRHVSYKLRKDDVQVLSRFNMLKQRLTVSRKQCVVSCLADGSATLTSVGRGATLWREQGGPWCSVQRGEGLVLSDGDQVSGCNPMRARLQPHALEAATPRTGCHLAAFACGQVSLDCNEPDEVVFTCQKCAARQGGSQQREAHGEGGYRQGGGQSASQQSGYLQDEYAQQAAQQQLPYPWVQMADQDGALYYSNPLTGEAQWEAPHFTPQPGQGVDDYRQYPQQGGY